LVTVLVRCSSLAATLPESRAPSPASIGKVKGPNIIETFHADVSALEFRHFGARYLAAYGTAVLHSDSPFLPEAHDPYQ